ncbi:MAG: hypothetical protein R3F19_11950 [Verrucomicrobiales bacterium]
MVNDVMKNRWHLFILPVAAMAVALAMTACGTTKPAVTNALLGGAGAYVGNEFTDGEPEGALLGAAAGVAAGSLLNHWEEVGKTGAFRSGYEKGRSDEVKRLYWIQKRMHEGGADGDGLYRGYYEIPVPEHVAADGTLIEQHTQVVEVVE